MLEAIIIGLIQGLTEFLPISSTGHMLIAQEFLNCRRSDAFNVLIQAGSILAVVMVFKRDIQNFFLQWSDPAQKDYVLKLAATFGITCVGGFIAKMAGLKLPETILPVALALIVGGIIILVIETRSKKTSLAITWHIVVAVAVGQIIAAIFPGASRSGMAIMGALLIGLSRPQAVKFSFLVGIPTMFAASLLQLLGALKSGETQDLFTLESIVAYATAIVSSWLAVVWLLKFVQSKNFIPFAWYRIALGSALLVYLIT